jgi:hypothetical protein
MTQMTKNDEDGMGAMLALRKHAHARVSMAPVMPKLSVSFLSVFICEICGLFLKCLVSQAAVRSRYRSCNRRRGIAFRGPGRDRRARG